MTVVPRTRAELAAGAGADSQPSVGLVPTMGALHAGHERPARPGAHRLRDRRGQHLREPAAVRAVRGLLAATRARSTPTSRVRAGRASTSCGRRRRRRLPGRRRRGDRLAGPARLAAGGLGAARRISAACSPSSRSCSTSSGPTSGTSARRTTSSWRSSGRCRPTSTSASTSSACPRCANRTGSPCPAATPICPRWTDRRALALSRALFAGRAAAAGGTDAVLAAAQQVLGDEPGLDVDYLVTARRRPRGPRPSMARPGCSSRPASARRD